MKKGRCALAIQQKRERKKSQDISYENQSFLDLCLSMTTMIDTPTPSFSPFYFSIELALECEAQKQISQLYVFSFSLEGGNQQSVKISNRLCAMSSCSVFTNFFFVLPPKHWKAHFFMHCVQFSIPYKSCLVGHTFNFIFRIFQKRLSFFLRSISWKVENFCAAW